MKRTIHDSFAKEWMQELLADFGTVEVEHEVFGEVRPIPIERRSLQFTSCQKLWRPSGCGF